jgi:proline racemase
MIRHFRTIDAHVAGAPVRLLLDGFPSPVGATIREKEAWLRRRADRWRLALLLEPRGHAELTGVLITEPCSAQASVGMIFMRPGGFAALSGHGVVGAVTIAVERGLLGPGPDGRLAVETVLGIVGVQAETEADRRGALRVTGVTLDGPPSFVLEGRVPVTVSGRPLLLDIAYGGEFFAIVDAEAGAVPLDRAKLHELRRAGAAIAAAAQETCAPVHPLDPANKGIAGAIFIGAPRSEGADLRTVSVLADGTIDRSPSATGTFAVMAVLDAMGMLAPGHPLVTESLIDTTFRTRLRDRARVGELAAILPALETRAWVTGEHDFVVDDEDPLSRPRR